MKQKNEAGQLNEGSNLITILKPSLQWNRQLIELNCSKCLQYLSNQALQMIGRGLQWVLQASPHIQTLDLSSNNLTSLPRKFIVSSNNPLSNLYMEYNKIRQMPFGWSSQLQITKQLNISYNSMVGLRELVKMGDFGLTLLAIHENQDPDFRQFDAYGCFQSLQCYWFF